MEHENSMKEKIIARFKATTKNRELSPGWPWYLDDKWGDIVEIFIFNSDEVQFLFEITREGHMNSGRKIRIHMGMSAENENLRTTFSERSWDEVYTNVITKC